MAKRDVCLCVVRSNVMCVCVWSIASGVHSKTTACVSQVGWWLGAVVCLKFWCIVQWTGETAAWRRRRQRSRHRLDRRQLFIVNIITTTTTTTSHSSSSSTSPPQPQSCIATTTTTIHSSSSSTSPPQPQSCITTTTTTSHSSSSSTSPPQPQSCIIIMLTHDKNLSVTWCQHFWFSDPLHISVTYPARKLKFDVLVQDSSCRNVTLQASGALSPSATSDFWLLLTYVDPWLCMFFDICSFIMQFCRWHVCPCLFWPRDAMHKCGLCCDAVSVCLSVCHIRA